MSFLLPKFIGVSGVQKSSSQEPRNHHYIGSGRESKCLWQFCPPAAVVYKTIFLMLWRPGSPQSSEKKTLREFRSEIFCISAAPQNNHEIVSEIQKRCWRDGVGDLQGPKYSPKELPEWMSPSHKWGIAKGAGENCH